MKQKWREQLDKVAEFLAPRTNSPPRPGKGALSKLAILFFAGVGLMLVVAGWSGTRTGVPGGVTQRGAVSPPLATGAPGGEIGTGLSGADGRDLTRDAGSYPSWTPEADEAYRRDLVHRLTAILSAMEGAGEVQVEVVLATSTQNEYAHRENQTEKRTDEKDASGGSRVISETAKQEELAEVSASGSVGEGAPVVVVSRQPEVAGVVVVAGGAVDGGVRERLSRAVQTLLGLPAHRVEVFARRR